MTNINSYTWSAEYDYARDGNIDSKTVNSLATDFEYTGDLMTDIGSDELTWDYNGQLTESTIASLEYNWSGKLRKAKIGQSDVISSIKYDPMGNRVYKEVPGDPCSVKRRYIVDIASRLPTILCVIDADDGSLERSYIYSGAQPIAFYEGSNDDPNYFYLHDRLGSVRQVLDSAGNVKNTYTYTPFGTDPNSQFAETVDNPFRFTGQWYDSEIDQYHLRARMYDPQLMRFASVDPFFGKFTKPLTIHKYLYCANDSVNWTDPLGLFFSLPGAGTHYDEVETQILLDFAVDVVDIFPLGPILAFVWSPIYGPMGMFDYKGSGYEFDRAGTTLSGSEFGNYLAGYASYSVFGKKGKTLTQLGGDFYEALNLGNEYWFDDPGSRFYITAGVLHAHRDMGKKNPKAIAEELLLESTLYGNMLEYYMSDMEGSDNAIDHYSEFIDY